ncbi:hypothetical protein EBR96_00095 [bacterium]|nr:hypothetical protein [bacterium]
MNIYLKVPLLSSLSVLVMGLGCLALYAKRLSLEGSNPSKLLVDGIGTYSKRIYSNILQILVYLLAVILMFSIGFDKPFPKYQFIAVIVGALTALLGAIFQFLVLPSAIRYIVESSKTYPSASLNAQFTVGSSIAAVYCGALTLGLWFSMVMLGSNSIIGFGVGVMLASFFLRIGGAIFRSAGAVGNELGISTFHDVGSVDRRNPGTFLDILGILHSNIIGFSADIFGSFVFAVTACIIFAQSKAAGLPLNGIANPLVRLPIFIYSIALLGSIVAFFWCRWRIKRNEFSNVFLEGVYVTVILAAIGSYVAISSTAGVNLAGGTLGLFVSYIIGLICAVLVAFSSEYLTSARFNPSREVAAQLEIGPALVLGKAIEHSFLSNGLLFLYIIGTSVIAYSMAGLYGIAMASMGMLSVVSIILAANVASPIAMVSSKMADLENESDITRQNTRKVEQIAGTTIAIRNGFASGAGLLATFALILSLLSHTQFQFEVSFFSDIVFMASVVAGLSLPYVFLSVVLRGARNAIVYVADEVVRQFREIAFLKEGKANPDIHSSVDELSRRSMDALVVPGILMLLPPIALVYLGAPKLVLGFALGTFFTSFNNAYLWGNLGDSLQQARSYIETGHLGGKTISTFSSIRSADQSGSMFRDVLSPSITILLKAVSMVTFLLILGLG